VVVIEAGRHLPRAAAIDAYGKGGFRFAGMSHRGSLLCLPHGIWASAVTSAGEIGLAELSLVFAPETVIDHFIIGTGKDPAAIPQSLRVAFRERRVALEAMTTGAAVRTYNILFGERRRVGALLVAVD
jgi:uncharacterized protein